MVALVVALDAVAISIFYLAGVGHAEPRVRMAFTGIWMLVTLVIVLTGLTRIRRARLASFRRPESP